MSLPKGDCHHQVKKKVITMWTEAGRHHLFDKRWLPRPPMGLLSRSQQEGDVVTMSTRGCYTVDQWGCRPQVSKKGMSLPSRQEVIPQSTNGVAVSKSATRGCRHQVNMRSSHSRATERGHQVNPGTGTPSQPMSGDIKLTQGAGTPSQPKERGHQVNPQRMGDTKSTHRERETPSQPSEKGRHRLNPRRKGGYTKPTEGNITGCIN